VSQGTLIVPHIEEISMNTIPTIPICHSSRLRSVVAFGLLTGTFLMISPWANAQNADAVASDPKSAVPTVTYRSVFRETSLGIEQEKIDWRKANNDVGRFERGHVDILKSEDMDEKKAPAPAPRNNSTHRH
jgi:hypothetical protein